MGGQGQQIELDERKEAIELIEQAVSNGARKEKACEYLGVSIRTVQRWKNEPEEGDRRKGPWRIANKITETERLEILVTVNSEKYMDLSPQKIVPLLADEGRYIASESTFYRVMREEKLLEHRGRSAEKKKRERPIAVATKPNELWSWDITYLNSPVRGMFFYLYMFEDIYSRKIVGWEVHESESQEYSALLAEKTILEEGVDGNELILHSDNGGPMKGSTMLATLQRLGVVPSFSRPRVSDDNPYSEALFKTLKYSPTYPLKAFESLEQAREWVREFVRWYNNEHLHSGIKYVTPSDRHKGLDKEILKKRKEVYEKAKKRNPERWSGGTRNWSCVEEVGLNTFRKKEKLSTVVC